MTLQVAIFFHHIPEGIAMGVAFGAINGEVKTTLFSLSV